MLKRMLNILPLVIGSLPVVLGSAWYAAFKLAWQFPNILQPSVTVSPSMNFVGFVLIGFLAWPIAGVMVTLPLLKLYDVRKLARRRKLVSSSALLVE